MKEIPKPKECKRFYYRAWEEDKGKGILLGGFCNYELTNEKPYVYFVDNKNEVAWGSSLDNYRDSDQEWIQSIKKNNDGDFIVSISSNGIQYLIQTVAIKISSTNFQVTKLFDVNGARKIFPLKNGDYLSIKNQGYNRYDYIDVLSNSGRVLENVLDGEKGISPISKIIETNNGYIFFIQYSNEPLLFIDANGENHVLLEKNSFKEKYPKATFKFNEIEIANNNLFLSTTDKGLELLKIDMSDPDYTIQPVTCLESFNGDENFAGAYITSLKTYNNNLYYRHLVKYKNGIHLSKIYKNDLNKNSCDFIYEQSIQLSPKTANYTTASESALEEFLINDDQIIAINATKRTNSKISYKESLESYTLTEINLKSKKKTFLSKAIRRSIPFYSKDNKVLFMDQSGINSFSKATNEIIVISNSIIMDQSLFEINSMQLSDGVVIFVGCQSQYTIYDKFRCQPSRQNLYRYNFQ